MVSHHVFSQLVLFALIWLFILLYLTRPKHPVTAPDAPADPESLTPKRHGSVANFAQGGMKGQTALVCVGITQPVRRTVRPHCGPPHGLLHAALYAACA